jgi:putative ABC transport system permease protein
MTTLHRASLGFLIRHPWQLGLAILGICIGVAVMVAVDLANQSSRKAFLQSMDTVNGQATHQILGGPDGVDESLYTMLRVEHGIRSIAPVVTGYVRIGDETLQVLGIDVFAESEFRSYTSPANPGADLSGADDNSATSTEGTIRQFLSADGSVLLSQDAANRLGLNPGVDFELLANGKRFPAKMIGTTGGDLMITDIANAQRWLDMRGHLSRIDVRIDDVDDAEEEAQAQALRELLPAGVNLLSASGRTQTTVDMSNAFMTNLAAMSLLAMLVGIFLIYNSVAFSVLQRRELIGVLRALGVTRREVSRLILTEAAIIGAIGASLGVLFGVWLGERLLVLVARTVSDHYFMVNVTSVSISAISVTKGLVVGFGATIVAAAIPATEASSFQPRLALTRSTIEQKAGRLVPGLAVAGAGMMLLAALLLKVSTDSLVAGLSALFILILGFAICIPLLVRTMSALFEPLAGRVGGAAGRLAIGGVGRTLSRTGVAIVALAIAVSATIGVSVMVESFRVSVGEWLENTLQSDVYVGVPRGSIDPDLLADLVATSGIREFSTSRRALLETELGRTRIVAIEMAPGSYDGTRLRVADPAEAWQAFDNESAVLVSDSYAWRHSVTAGDEIRIDTSEGPVDLSIAAVYQSYDSNDGAIMMSRETYNHLFDDVAIDSIGLYLDDAVDADALMDELRTIGAGRQALIMNSNARIREISLSIFDRTFVITNVLYWLAVAVAVIGILGAMLALQLERAREFGVLRALGMTPRQTGVLVNVQTGFIGFLAGIAAMPLGLLMAWVLIVVINRRAFGWQIDFVVDPAALGWALLLAIGAALFAGLYPSWRAAGTLPALAMREE